MHEMSEDPSILALAVSLIIYHHKVHEKCLSGQNYAWDLNILCWIHLSLDSVCPWIFGSTLCPQVLMTVPSWSLHFTQTCFSWVITLISCAASVQDNYAFQKSGKKQWSRHLVIKMLIKIPHTVSWYPGQVLPTTPDSSVLLTWSIRGSRWKLKSLPGIETCHV